MPRPGRRVAAVLIALLAVALSVTALRRVTLQGVTAIPSSAGLVDVRRASIR